MNHDVKRTAAAVQTDAARAQTANRIATYRQLRSLLMTKKKSQTYDTEALQASEKVLEENPDLYDVWNYRRRCLQSFIKTQSQEDALKLLKDEIALTQTGIAKNPKSYWVWLHRKLMLEWAERVGVSLWKKDLELCNAFLAKDARNFLCWAYRRIVADRAAVPDKAEFDYTTKKITENFSNYSAWHQRSMLLLRCYPDAEKQTAAIAEELKWIQNAYFTDPDDQSAWIYMRWLLTVAKPSDDLVHSQLSACDELLSIAPNSKWALITKVFLLKLLKSNANATDPIVEQLLKVDKLHENYYRSLISK